MTRFDELSPFIDELEVRGDRVTGVVHELDAHVSLHVQLVGGEPEVIGMGLTRDGVPIAAYDGQQWHIPPVDMATRKWIDQVQVAVRTVSRTDVDGPHSQLCAVEEPPASRTPENLLFVLKRILTSYEDRKNRKTNLRQIMVDTSWLMTHGRGYFFPRRVIPEAWPFTSSAFRIAKVIRGEIMEENLRLSSVPRAWAWR